MLRRLALALALAGLSSLTLSGQAQGHAQLVSSSPGAGEVLAEAPTELRLVFSEPADPSYAGLDLLDADGRPVASDVGEADASDPRVLVAAVDPLPDGVYTVSWHVLSAADGHVTEGSFTFGVGDVEVPTQAGDGGAGQLHPGQSPPEAVLDAAGRLAGFAGAMLAFGLPLIGLAVLLPCLGEWPRLIHRMNAAALGLAALGSVALIMGGAIGLEGSSSPVQYAVGTHTGALLTGRLLIAAAGCGLVLALGPGPRGALIGGVAGAACLVLIAMGSHAAAGGVIGPVLADLVHLAAAGAWLAGLLALALLAAGALGPVASSPPMRVAVPRFSALALVSVALIAATGLYASWLQVGSPGELGTPYGLLLVAKVALVGVALVLGAVNYLGGGRGTMMAGGLRRRVSIELGLAALVVLASANLTSGSPPAQVESVQVPTGAEDAGFALAIQPALPGPNRAFVTAPLPGIHAGTIELQLSRLDAGTGATRVPLRSDPNAAHGVGFMADGLLLPEGGRWDASVVVRDAEGIETARQRFSFGMAATGLEVDRGFALSPGLVVGTALLLVGVLALAYWLGGGSLPRTARDLGRRAILVGGVLGGGLGIALLLLGPNT